MYLEIIEILLRGFCVGVAASITVGPVAVLCIQRTLSKSRHYNNSMFPECPILLHRLPTMSLR